MGIIATEFVCSFLGIGILWLVDKFIPRVLVWATFAKKVHLKRLYHALDTEHSDRRVSGAGGEDKWASRME